MTKRVALVGLDWDAIDLIESLSELAFAGVFARDDPGGGLVYLGRDEDWTQTSARDPNLRVLVAVDIPELRRSLALRYGAACLTVKSADAHISPRAALGQGCLVQRGVTVMPLCSIGDGVKLNIGSVVHHECTIGSHSTIAPGARLLGRVIVADDVFVGASATILPKRRIGRGATIGAGAVVVHDVPDAATVVGVPARVVKRGS